MIIAGKSPITGPEFGPGGGGLATKKFPNVCRRTSFVSRLLASKYGMFIC